MFIAATIVKFERF